MAKLHEASDGSLTKAYIELREQRARRKDAYTAEDEADKAKQERIEGEFMRRFNERGIDSCNARGIGTAYRSKRVSVSVADRPAYFGWVAEDPENRLAFLESRANKTAVEEYRQANDDLPPGLNWSEAYTINIRRD